MKASDDSNLLRFFQIQAFQMQAIMEHRLRMKMKQKEDIKNKDPSEVNFSCRGCSKEVCTGEDIEVIEDIHRVNVTPQFRWERLHSEATPQRTRLHFCPFRLICSNKNLDSYRELFIRKENTKPKNSLLDYETNGYIVCGTCGQVSFLGYLMQFNTHHKYLLNECE